MSVRLVSLGGAIFAHMASAGAVMALSLGEMAQEAAADLDRVPAFISITFYVVGVMIGGFALLKLKRHVDHPQAIPLASGVVALIVSGALIAAPTVINAVVDTFGASSGTTLTRPSLD